MLAAIEGAQKQVLLETYIWKGDAVGQRFKKALIDAADRGVEVRVIYDAFANLVVRPPFKHFPPSVKVLRYPVYSAGWRFFDLRRYGRDHRKILVVDDKVGFVGGYNIGSRLRHRVARHPLPDHRARRLGPQRGRSPTSGTCTATSGSGAREPPMLMTTAVDWEPRIRVHRNVPRLWMFPIRAMYLEAINRATAQHLADPRLLHPRRELRRRPRRRRPAAGSTYACCCRRSPTTSWPTGSRAATSGGCSTPASRSTGSATRWCTPRRPPSTASGRTIGTANIDRLSMTGNYEINVEIIDASLAEEMERIFETDLTNALELTIARVGGAGRLQPVHRDDPAAAAPVALKPAGDGYWRRLPSRATDPVAGAPHDH